MGRTIGVVMPGDTHPADMTAYARRAEDLGFDAVWVVEDCFLGGGIAQTMAVLGATSTMTVGIGILPAAARNPAFAAMELATVSGLYPGRVIIGIGHGMPGWMQQAGSWTASPLTMLRETLLAIGSLLRGESVTVQGRYVSLTDVRLTHPPELLPPIVVGVRGPRSLHLAAELADGVVLAEPVTPEYLASVREHTGPDLPIHAYNVAAVDDDADRARRLVRAGLSWIGEPDWAPHIQALPFAAEFTDLRRRHSRREDFAAALPNEWVDQLAITGTPADARRQLARLDRAGSGHAVLIPAGPDAFSALTSLAGLLPDHRG
jgi:alkanesulfonate monooxygenase SsuD/methylene tetrahydromethanopterin reductase-like flavin-dependent oxidoreductase (luciferase family)